jgi:hypothetical protein
LRDADGDATAGARRQWAMADRGREIIVQHPLQIGH